VLIRDEWVGINFRDQILKLLSIELGRVNRSPLEPVCEKSVNNIFFLFVEEKKELRCTIDRNPVRFLPVARVGCHQEFVVRFQRSRDAN